MLYSRHRLHYLLFIISSVQFFSHYQTPKLSFTVGNFNCLEVKLENVVPAFDIWHWNMNLSVESTRSDKGSAPKIKERKIPVLQYALYYESYIFEKRRKATEWFNVINAVFNTTEASMKVKLLNDHVKPCASFRSSNSCMAFTRLPSSVGDFELTITRLVEPGSAPVHSLYTVIPEHSTKTW